jgi:hypothetical protein
VLLLDNSSLSAPAPNQGTTSTAGASSASAPTANQGSASQ